MSARRGPGRPRHPDVLTPAEWRIVHAVRHGLSNRAIARRTGKSRDAVKFHLRNIRAKLGFDGREAIRHWSAQPLGTYGAPKEGDSELSALKLGQIGQISRQVRDPAGAEAWFRDVLGLPHLFTYGDLVFFDCGGVRLFLSRPEDGREPGPQAVLYFEVAEIEAAQAALAARGVRFRGAPHLIHRHESGEEEWMTFFEDMDGQLLALMSRVRLGQ